MLTSTTLDRKYPFQSNLNHKFRIACLSYMLVLQLFQILEFDCDVHFSSLRPEIVFLSKFGPKNRNCVFKLKFAIVPSSSRLNQIVIGHFLCFRSRKIGPKVQNCSFTLNLGNQTSSIFQEQMVVFTNLFLDHKYRFRANLAEKFKNVCLS